MKAKKILLVDDEPTIVKIMQSRLRANRYEVETAHNGEDALSKAQTMIPDLIVLDVLMPGLSGYDVCRQLKNTPATKDIPVLMFTANEAEGFMREGMDAGAVDVINKPFVADLLKAIRETLEPSAGER